MSDMPTPEPSGSQPNFRHGDIPRGLVPVDLYRAAIVCGLAPLIIGTSILLLWLIFRWEALQAAGLCTILGGVLSVLVGFCLLAALVTTQRTSPVSRPASGGRRKMAIRYFASIAILLVNFPAAAFIIMIVDDIATRYIVT